MDQGSFTTPYAPQFTLHGDILPDQLISPDGKHLILSSREKGVLIVDAISGIEKNHLSIFGSGPVKSLAWGPLNSPFQNDVLYCTPSAVVVSNELRSFAGTHCDNYTILNTKFSNDGGVIGYGNNCDLIVLLLCI